MPTYLQTSIPTLPASSPLGHLRQYVPDPLSFLEKHTQTQGDTFHFRLVGRHLVTTRDPNLIQDLLQSQHRDVQKNKAYKKLQLLLGQGLFTSEGDYWLANRRMIQPAFHREQIAEYMQVMRQYAQDLMSSWEPKGKQQLPIDFLADMTQYTLAVIAKTMLGVDLKGEAQAVSAQLPLAMNILLKKITSPLATPMGWPTPNNRRFRRATQELDALLLNLIEQRRQQRASGPDLLSTLLQLKDENTGQGLSDEQLRDEMMTFFLAGHETTAVALTWVLYTLLQHPSWLLQLQTELREQLPMDYTPHDLQQVPSLMPLLQECMRLMPSVWILGRQTKRELTWGNNTLPEGASVIFSPYLVHRH
ncbi:MAG: cytochrome P450, partial [Bacteroidota bacterium]